MGNKLITILLTTSMTFGCAHWEKMDNTSKGAVIGVLGGATAGALIGNSGQGALIGAVGGGLAGAGIGHYMDKQAQDFHKALAAEIRAGYITVVKHPNQSIVVTMTASTSFDSNSARLKADFYSTLNKIAQIVNKYGKTTLEITGYTDNTGSDAINQPLSEQRATAVANYLLEKKVIPQRVVARGRGASNPIASNASDAGRRLNRRVEIVIRPITA